MSCVVGMSVGTHTIIAADRAGSADGFPTCYSPKIVQRGDVAMGFVGATPMWTELKYPDINYPGPKYDGTLEEWCAQVLARRLWSYGENLLDDDKDYALLVGRASELVYVAHPMQAFSIARGFMAIGSGGNYAMGVMRAFLPDDDTRLTVEGARSIVRRAVEVAIEYDPYCGGEIDLLVV